MSKKRKKRGRLGKYRRKSLKKEKILTKKLEKP